MLGFLRKDKFFVVEFDFYDAPATRRSWWLIIQNGEVDLCVQSPEEVVNLHISSKLRDLTDIWMGHISLEDAKSKKLITLKGADKNVRTFKNWFSLSIFADIAPVIKSN